MAQATYPPPQIQARPDAVALAQQARTNASVLALVQQGKLNAVPSDFTLTANAASTTLTDPRLTVNSFVLWMPMTANAAAEIGAGTMYVLAADMNNGSWTVTHANNAQADRTFRLLVIG